MHPNAQLIESFYSAFQRRDGAAMAACYHPDVHFSDPVFPDLKGSRAGAMWKMLTARKDSDLKVVFSEVSADDTKGTAHWDARYSFPDPSGRKVHNEIDARFEFKDGKIIRHIDSFDLYKWTRMAMGPAGIVLGWTPFFQNTVRKKAGGRLEKFISAQK